MLPIRPALAVVFGIACVAAACGGDDAVGDVRQDTGAVAGGGAPDVPPVLRSTAMPFQYPPTLYERRVQANVVLRLFVDSAGRVVPESTLVQERSGYAELDSAAVAGARELEFSPARRDGAPVGMQVLLPVHYRHPAPDTTAGGGTE
ncbi:MAG TPA: TonB family protein [Gemmatimonadales bacterium]